MQEQLSPRDRKYLPIGVILGGRGPDPPLFGSGRTDPPLYKYTKSEILLGPHFSDQSYATVLTHASRGSVFHRRLSVCLSVYPHDISKTAAARITKLDTKMFHHEYLKPIYFGVKRSKVRVTDERTSETTF